MRIARQWQKPSGMHVRALAATLRPRVERIVRMKIIKMNAVHPDMSRYLLSMPFARHKLQRSLTLDWKSARTLECGLHV